MKKLKLLLLCACSLFAILAAYRAIFWHPRPAPIPVVEAAPNGPGYGATLPLDALFIEDPSTQKMFNSWAKGSVSNGLLCAASLFPGDSKPGVLSEMAIYVVNLRTNRAYPCMHLPPEALFKIKLFDSNGIAVKRTSEGEKYVDWSDKQCVDWYSDMCAKRGAWAFMVLPQPDCYTHVGWVNLQKLFELHQPGDYTFHVSLRVLELKMNATGQRDHFEKTMLPEAVVKVHFLTEDIKASQEFRKSQTNAPAKAQ